MTTPTDHAMAAAEEINRVNSARGHVLFGYSGKEAPIMNPDEQADIIQKSAVDPAVKELVTSLQWAIRQIGEPRLVKGQNDGHYNSYHAARVLIAKYTRPTPSA